MFWLRAKKHWVELSHLLPRCRRECSERKHTFELYSIFSNLVEWLLVELRTAIYVFRRTFSETFFWKSVFCFDSRTLSKTLVRLFPKCFRQFFQNWHPSVQKNKLRRQVFYGKFRLFLSIPDLEQKPNITFGISGFGKPVKNDFYSSRETFWREQIFENSYESDLFLILGIKRLAVWSDCLYVSSGTVMESWTFGGKSKFFCRFHTLCETFWPL